MKKELTLDEAYKITNKMTRKDHYNPTDEQRDAKELIYQQCIKPQFKAGEEVPPFMEPDFFEGWE